MKRWMLAAALLFVACGVEETIGVAPTAPPAAAPPDVAIGGPRSGVAAAAGGLRAGSHQVRSTLGPTRAQTPELQSGRFRVRGAVAGDPRR
jgi:hypothetical protein